MKKAKEKNDFSAEEISEARNKYNFYRSLIPEEKSWYFHHCFIELLDRVSFEFKREVLEEFFCCAYEIIKALVRDMCVVTSLTVNSTHYLGSGKFLKGAMFPKRGCYAMDRRAHVLEEIWDCPGNGAMIVDGNYGKNVVLLSKGIAQEALRKFFENVWPEIDEEHSICVYDIPMEDLREIPGWQLEQVLKREMPVFSFWFSIHPMLGMKWDQNRVMEKDVFLTVQKVIERHGQELQKR